MVIEYHPFGEFMPSEIDYLLLGSFPTKDTQLQSFYYTSKRNQFWKIMEHVYSRKLNTLNLQKQLFIDLKMAVGDIIYSCERRNNSNC